MGVFGRNGIKMQIEQIDRNFKKQLYKETENHYTYTMPCEGFDLYGVFYDEERGKFLRMDMDVAKQASAGVAWLNTHTSGGRIRFSTDSSTIGISVAYDELLEMSHMPLTGSSGFALLEKIGDTYKTVTVFRPEKTDLKGYSGQVVIGDHQKHEYVLFFPLYNEVKSLEIHLDKTAQLFEPEKYRDIKPILYYGASIDQGGCASRPDASYTATISKWNDIDFINLGFSGNCMGESVLAEYLSKIECSLFLMAYDGNAPSVEFLEKTHYPFYEIFRKGQKEVPIIFMSLPSFEHHMDCRIKKREVLYQSYLKARQQGDENVYFLDGETLFGEKDREICTVEGLHPNDLGFYRMAEVIYQKLGSVDEKFL